LLAASLEASLAIDASGTSEAIPELAPLVTSLAVPLDIPLASKVPELVSGTPDPPTFGVPVVPRILPEPTEPVADIPAVPPLLEPELMETDGDWVPHPRNHVIMAAHTSREGELVVIPR
jgi:hypothetical protein